MMYMYNYSTHSMIVFLFLKYLKIKPDYHQFDPAV